MRRLRIILAIGLLAGIVGAAWVVRTATRPAVSGIDAYLPSSAPFHKRVRPTTTSKPSLPRLYGTIITPETMKENGFDIQFRFYDSTVTRGKEPTTRTGMVRVLGVFDGPKIKEVDEISLLLLD